MTKSPLSGFSQILSLTLLLVLSVGLVTSVYLSRHQQILPNFASEPNVAGLEGSSLTPRSFNPTQFWTVPNLISNPPYTDNRVHGGWDSLFSTSEDWSPVLTKTQTFDFFWQEPYTDAGGFLERAVPLFKKYDVATGIEGGYPAVYSLCNSKSFLEEGKQAAIRAMTTDVDSIYQLGGQVNYYSLDGYLINRVNMRSCTETLDQAVASEVQFFKTFHAAHPETKIGIIVNFPNWIYKNTPRYWGTDDPSGKGDFSVALEKLITALAGAGEKIAFVHVDNPYDFAIGAVPTGLPTVNQIDWVQRILDLEHQVKGHGIRFGLIFNSARGGRSSDQRFYSDTKAYINLYIRRGGAPDDMIIESWYKYPANWLPVTQSYSFANLINQIYPEKSSFNGAASPVYRLVDSRGNHFYTASATEKIFSAVNGFTYEGVAFFAPTSSQSGTLPVYRLYNSSLGDYFYTLSGAERDQTTKTGWTYQQVAFYAYQSGQTGNFQPVYRLANSAGRHFYTVSAAEKDQVISSYGYSYGGIGFYVPSGQ